MEKSKLAVLALTGIILAGVSIAKPSEYSFPKETDVLNLVKKEKGTAFPVGEANTRFAKYFTGPSYVAPVSSDKTVHMFNVTFAPGSVNNWHIHHNSCQVLIGVAGGGYYQIWGDEVRKIEPGTSVTIPAETKHWHGAAPDHWFQHLAYMHSGKDVSTQWLEPVDKKTLADLAKFKNKDEKEMNQTYMTLNDNTRIPQFGIGVFQVPPEKTAEVVKKALEMGVRHIDTAHAYQNEKEVGIGMKESAVPREEIFLTTKLWPSEYGEGVTSAAIDKMLKRLGTDYIDLLLLHQPFNDYVGAWKDMERAVKDGRVKSIGLSNFDNERLDDILKIARIKPSVIQVECHPYYQQNALKEKIKPYDIALESWYPLGHADKDLLNEAVFTRLGQKYHKTNAQIILRWHIQENNIIFPRTMNPVHMKENAEIFDFELTASEMDEIRSLDKGKRFFNMPLNELEKNLGKFTPKD